MATSREAIAVVLDVGQFMGLPANDQGDSHLDLACECINWIVSRKIFTESKDEIALVLFGCQESDNPLAEGDQYQNISVIRQIQLPDFDFIKFIQNEVRPTNIDGDFLDALVVAIEVLNEGTEGKKFGLKSVTLFSNLGGSFSQDGIGRIAQSLAKLEIELNIIGPEIRSVNDDQDSQNSQDYQNSQGNHRESSGDAAAAARRGGSKSETDLRKKTDQMREGEKSIKKMYSLGIEGECYSPAEVIPMLCHFQKRTVRPMPWKCNMQIGNQTEIPICMYLKTRENKVKQVWKKMDPTNPETDVGVDRIYERLKFPEGNRAPFSVDQQPGQASDEAGPSAPKKKFNLPTEDEMRVEKEELVKGYKFGTTLVACTEADMAAMKYAGDGKCFQILGFPKRDDVKREEFMGEGVHYVLGNPGDDAGCAAFAAFVKAMLEEDRVGLVRYCYRAGSAPRMGVLFPKVSSKGCEMMAFVQMPFNEDYRWYDFPMFCPNDHTEPTESQNKVVDDLIDCMDLTQAEVNEDGERVEALRPGNVVNPRSQYLFECLRQRALYPDQPLAKPSGRFLEKLEPSREIRNLAEAVLKDIKREFPLEKVEKKKDARTAAEVFKTGDTVEPVSKMPREDKDARREREPGSGISGGRRRVGTVNPGRDFQDIIMENAELFEFASGQMCKVIEDFVFVAMGTHYYGKALDCLEVFRLWSVQFLEPTYYNDFLKKLKERVKALDREEFWDKVVEKKLGLISSEECSASDVTSQKAEDFLSQVAEKLPPPPAKEPKEEENLLDELE